jgi:hypothetical protein
LGVSIHGIKEPFSPDRFLFESNKDWAYFSLYFKAIPLKSCVIDVIEEEKPTKNNFNYYGVEVLMEEMMGVVG